MREEEFKQWLQDRGANAANGRNTRVHAVRTIEDKMPALGSPYADLNEAWSADGFDHLRRRLKDLREESAGLPQRLQAIVDETLTSTLRSAA